MTTRAMPHIVVTNNRVRMRFPIHDDAQAHATRALELLDGGDRFAVLLAPEIEGSEALEPSVTDFLQCAGSASAMTLELSELGSDGVVRRWILGRESVDRGEPVVIRWAESGANEVSGHEVWDASSAALLFVAYYEAGPSGVEATRRLDDEWHPRTKAVDQP